MKKIVFLFALLFHTSNAHAVFDIGVITGLSAVMSGGNPTAFTYGLTTSYGLGPISVGAKVMNFSLASVSQLNILGQIKYNSGGFFIGANVGPGITSATGSSVTQFVLGPTIGYYIGVGLKVGIEVDYNLSTAGSLAGGTFVPMVGAKIAL